MPYHPISPCKCSNNAEAAEKLLTEMLFPVSSVQSVLCLAWSMNQRERGTRRPLKSPGPRQKLTVRTLRLIRRTCRVHRFPPPRHSIALLHILSKVRYLRNITDSQYQCKQSPSLQGKPRGKEVMPFHTTLL